MSSEHICPFMCVSVGDVISTISPVCSDEFSPDFHHWGRQVEAYKA